MKTTLKTSAQKKLNKLVESKQISKTSIVYGWVNDLINGYKQFNTCYSQGKSWKHSSLVDKTKEFTNVLDKMGIEYIVGNDAPRGGRTGEFVKIITIVK
jgi:hypothetical protein